MIKLRSEIASIPVSQPETPQTKTHKRVLDKTSTIPKEERGRVEGMEENLPGIVDLVNQLDHVIPRPTEITEIGAEKPKSEIEKYLEWRKSEHFYGRLASESDYLTGQHLVELVEGVNQADIAVVNDTREKSEGEMQMERLKGILKEIAGRLGAHGHEINEFEIEYLPNEYQLAQLGLLKMFVEITTGTPVVNDLFIYKGTGSKGINLTRKAIGMHESLFDVSFTEALSTFDHEIAHNDENANGHDVRFMHAMQAVFVTQIARLQDISMRLYLGKQLSNEELVILDIQDQWGKLQNKIIEIEQNAK